MRIRVFLLGFILGIILFVTGNRFIYPVNEKTLGVEIEEAKKTYEVQKEPEKDGPTVFLTPTVIPSPVPTATPTEIPVPLDLKDIFERYTIQFEVDKYLLIKIAHCESRLNPSAVNGPYKGLFQFEKRRWVSHREAMGLNPDPELRLDSEEAVKTAAFVVSLGKTYIWPNCAD